MQVGALRVKEKIRARTARISETLALCGLQSLCQLIRAGGLLHAAGNAFHASDDIIYVHAFYQGSDALQVAVTAAKELNIADLVVFRSKQII